jgi:hypothetical protein
VNGEPNGERTEQERDVSERMRELGRRSGEARRRRREKRQAGELELTDRDQAKIALRRALDGNNMAAMVAAAKALIEFDRSPERQVVTVEDARAQLIARLDEIEERRRARGETWAACGGAGYIVRSRGPHRGAGDGRGTGAPVGRGPEPKQLSGEPPVVPPASVAGPPGGENPQLSAQATWNLRSRSCEGWDVPDGDDDRSA